MKQQRSLPIMMGEIDFIKYWPKKLTALKKVEHEEEEVCSSARQIDASGNFCSQPSLEELKQFRPPTDL